MDLTEEREWLAGVLTEQIPLGSAMALKIERLDEQGIVLCAPLEPNVNDKGTAFGGALVSLMILAGWSLPRLLLRREGIKRDLVIGRCEVRFRAPVTGAFRAECMWPPEEAIVDFISNARSGGRARFSVQPRIVQSGKAVAMLEGRYAAL